MRSFQAEVGTIPSKKYENNNLNILSSLKDTDKMGVSSEELGSPNKVPRKRPGTLTRVPVGELGPLTGVPGNPTEVPIGHCLPQDPSLPDCPPIPAHLVGRLKVDLKPPTWAEVAKVSLGEAKPGIGGGFCPLDCVAKDKVALVLPYRNRPDQLRTFLNHIHPILMRQDIQYQIFIVNQVSSLFWYA